MKNFVQPGDVISVTAPAGGVTSGDMVAINSLLGVAAFDAAAGAAVEVAVTGVFDLPKLSTDVVAQGDTLYWDSGNAELTLTSTSNSKVGYAVEAAGNGVTTVRIRLTPGVA